MGPNGSGKTSLLRVMAGLASPDGGQVWLARSERGQPLRRAIVLQKPVMLKRTAAANIAFARSAAGHRVDDADIERLLRLVGLSALANRPARRLSGGEQQRLALARALARDPELLLLDEPTASLDPAQTKAIEEIIATVAASGVKVVIATHARGQAKRLAGEVVFLVHGKLAEQTPIGEFFTHARTEAARRFLAGDLLV
jgi:tungstate transport system ATP-binding protein